MSAGPPSSASSPVNPGDILVGRYRVEKVLGMGNMGIVVAATHLHMRQRFALKFMLANRNTSQELLDRFMREARAALVLKTEHVARVSDVGYLDGGAPYIAMEFLEGNDLSVVLRERGPLPIAEAVDYILQACEAVGEAHAAGIVHRDIKPANLFLTKGVGNLPCVKVLDFGISKFAGDEGAALTKTDAIMGSPLYMSKEQMTASKNVDGRSDIWSLAATLYELLAGCGKTPFLADSMPRICMRICLEEPTPLATYRPDVPAGLWGVFLHAVEKERDRRFGNVAEFAAALAPFASPRSAAYVERVAAAVGASVAPARPADVLPPAPSGQYQPAPPSIVAASSGISSAPVGAASTAVAPLAAIGSATTGSALSRPAAGPTPRSRRGPLVAGVLAALVVVVLAVVGVSRWRASSAAAVTGTAAVANPPSGSPSVGAAPPAPTDVTPGAASAAPTSVAASATVAPAPRGAGTQRGPVPRAAPPAPPAPATRPPQPSGNPYDHR